MPCRNTTQVMAGLLFPASHSTIQSMRKYDLLPPETVYIARVGNDMWNVNMHRIIAKIDIPRHGVKKGDLGGYVENPHILSDQGDAWIGGDAKAYGKVRVEGDALIADKARVVNDNTRTSNNGFLKVSGNAVIKGNAFCFATVPFETVALISENAVIEGYATVRNPKTIAGNARIYEDAILEAGCSVLDDARIGGSAHVGVGCIISRNARIYGKATIGSYSEVTTGSVIAGTAKLAQNSFSKNVLNPPLVVPEEPAVAPVVPAHTHGVLTGRAVYEEILRDINQSVDAYRSDIISLIKYPVMSDLTNEYTLAMVTALKQAERASKGGTDDEFKESVLKAEEKFLAAESNARKISTSSYSDDERKKTEKARDLFSIALNEASAEQEKRAAFKQGFLQLEGVIDVPETAIKALGIKAGLKELEA